MAKEAMDQRRKCHARNQNFKLRAWSLSCRGPIENAFASIPLLLKVEICAEDAVERDEELGVVGEHAGLALDGERVRHRLHHRVAEELHAVALGRIAVLMMAVGNDSNEVSCKEGRMGNLCGCRFRFLCGPHSLAATKQTVKAATGLKHEVIFTQLSPRI